MTDLKMMQATQEDLDHVQDIAELLRFTIGLNTPNETDYPGVTSLVVTALIVVAGEMLHGIQSTGQRASTIAYFQEQLSAIAMGKPTTKH